MKKPKDRRSQQFEYWLSGALSLAALLSGLPAHAEESLLLIATLTDRSNVADSKSTRKTLFSTFDSNNQNSNKKTVLNRDHDRVSSSSSELPLPAIAPPISQIAASAEPIDSEETLTQSDPSAEPLLESSTEANQLVPLIPIAQADDPTQPAEPTAEPEPAKPEPTEPEPAAEPFPTAPNRDWQFSVEPYFFAPFDVDADVTVSGRSTSLDLGLDDILSLDRAFDAGLRFRGQNGRWGFILDGFYLYAENSGSLDRTFSSGSIFEFVQETSPGRLEQFVQQFDPQQLQQFIQIGQQIGLDTPIRISADGTVSIRQIVIDAAVSYRVVDTSLNNSPETNFYPRLAVAPILGVRTNFLRQTVEVDDIQINGRQIPDRALPPIDREFRFSRTLVEPLVGAQVDLALSEQWSFGLRGDVSGFNVGARRNFTWNLIFGTQYNITRNFALQLAYRLNHFEFETGEGLRETELSLNQNGLLLNAAFRF